eukprot:scaffold47284_cov20-Tisochrysis_lutea.AAC.3
MDLAATAITASRALDDVGSVAQTVARADARAEDTARMARQLLGVLREVTRVLREQLADQMHECLSGCLQTMAQPQWVVTFLLILGLALIIAARLVPAVPKENGGPVAERDGGPRPQQRFVEACCALFKPLSLASSSLLLHRRAQA